MTSFRLILGGTSCTLCRTEVSPSRAGGFHAPTTETHSLKIRLPASYSQSAPVFSPLGRVIAAVSSLCGRRLAGKLERGGPVGARFPALVTSYEGPRAGFVNFCRPHLAAGKPIAFFHRTLRVLQDFACEWTKHLHLLQSAEPFGLVARVYGQHISKRKSENVRQDGEKIHV